MAYKPEIQYIGQFYVHGSEARALELEREKEKKKAKTSLPLERLRKVRKIHVDVLAICSILLCIVMVVTMGMSMLHLQDAWHELKVAQEYRMSLEKVNRTLAINYRSGYDPEIVRAAALEMGMVPVEELATTELTVTIPVQEPDPTVLEEILWFLKGLLA